MKFRTVLPTLISVGNTYMRRNKNTALTLRLQGKSYSEISKILGAPKSTLSGWLSRVVISERLKTKIEQRAAKKSIEGLIRRNKNQTILAKQRAYATRKVASEEIRPLSNADLLLIGSALYWAEGYKRPIVRNGRKLTHHPVSLTNSDPYLVKIFLRFLREYCKVPNERIKASIRIFPNQNAGTLTKYWQKETEIPIQNFGKIYNGISKSSRGKRPFNRLPYGVVQIVVADTPLFHRIIGYIEGIQKFV